MEYLTVEIVAASEEALTLRLVGELDTFTAPVLAQVIAQLPTAPVLRLVCDGLTFADAGGVNAILEVEAHQLRHGPFYVVEPSPLLHRVLSICNLERLIES